MGDRGDVGELVAATEDSASAGTPRGDGSSGGLRRACDDPRDADALRDDGSRNPSPKYDVVAGEATVVGDMLGVEAVEVVDGEVAVGETAAACRVASTSGGEMSGVATAGGVTTAAGGDGTGVASPRTGGGRKKNDSLTLPASLADVETNEAGELGISGDGRALAWSLAFLSARREANVGRGTGMGIVRLGEGLPGVEDPVRLLGRDRPASDDPFELWPLPGW